MDISIYFEPLQQNGILHPDAYQPAQLGKVIRQHSSVGFPDMEGVQLAIIGVKEDRKSLFNSGCAKAPDVVRNYLYKLYQPHLPVVIADLGNINPGFTIEDTYFALANTVKELVKKNIVPIILGGGQDLTYANYQAYEALEQIVNIVSVDSKFDLGEMNQELDSQSYLSKIILHQPNYLFNFSNIGYQTYFVDKHSIELMSKLFFDAHRLGYVRSNIEEVEPIVRNADIVSFDMSCIRFSDAPGNRNATPNGFYGEEACKIARYAGMSDKLSSIGFYELNPEVDQAEQSAHLLAQMIWYFMEGFCNRKKDFPIGSRGDFIKYRVFIQNNKYEIVFYKSPKSDRWWMDVPYPPNKKIKYERHHLVPCSYQDYQTACNEDMPDKWWLTFQKLC
ncbi:MAG TPA: formimidoylglutamase [Bacteroidia bacterium]|nr:formimidoylglutamase [Bacteroidia bacterium]